jgi:hypothetical protein
MDIIDGSVDARITSGTDNPAFILSVCIEKKSEIFSPSSDH